MHYEELIPLKIFSACRDYLARPARLIPGSYYTQIPTRDENSELTQIQPWILV